MEYLLTQYSPGAGCGCKIAPSVLDEILKNTVKNISFPQLLVGNDYRDDAAVFDLGDGNAIVSTTDFFMPIVDDAFDFGRIASANAISDVYAMGGKPLMAIAILGWPLEKLPAAVANRVIEGSRNICDLAGIPLAGGHSIDSVEPIFGLAVTGMVPVANIKKNHTAQNNNLIYLTKPLGIGILTTAQKQGILSDAHQILARDWMVKLNDAGKIFGDCDFVTAMTDVTGFGLLGHLLEMCTGSHCKALINWNSIPIMTEIYAYLEKQAIPGGTKRNWKSYGQKVGAISELQKNILCDPQTSGGLLVAVEAGYKAQFELLLSQLHLPVYCIGKLEKVDKEIQKYVEIL